MDLNYSAEEFSFRDEARAWLAANLPKDLREKVASYDHLSKDDLLRWHRILAKKGWVAPAWPKEWGGTDWNVVQRYIFEERLDDPVVAEELTRIKHRQDTSYHVSVAGELADSTG